MEHIRLDSPAAVVIQLLALGWLSYFVYANVRLERQRHAFKAQHGCQPPASVFKHLDPFGWVAMYEMIDAARNYRLLDYWHNEHKIRGPTYISRTVSRTVISTVDPENIKCVLATRFDDWSVEHLRQRGFGELLGRGVFTTDGAFWAHSRSMLRPQFEKSQVADLQQFETHLSDLLAHIPEDGSTVDLQELFHRFTMDTSTEFLTGTSADSLKDEKSEEARKFVECFELGNADAMDRVRLGWLYWLKSNRRAKEAVKYARSAVDGWVSGAIEYKNAVAAGSRKPAQGNYVFLNELAANDKVDAGRIRDETMNVLLAGRDTTASLLSDMWFSLARNPEVFAKLQAEVDELGGELPTYDRLRDMKYVKYCAQETLRLYPPVPLLAKTAIRDTVIPHGGGVDGKSPMFIAEGHIIRYTFRSLMRQESVYGPDADDFRPERWADPQLRPGWNFLAFGGGPRVCLGQQYALTEAYYVTIRLMQHYRKIENRDPQPWKEKMTITCCSLNGTQVALQR